jgi:hypothetical protein
VLEKFTILAMFWGHSSMPPKNGILTIKLFVGFCPFCYCCQMAKFVSQKNDLNVDWYEPKWNECPCYKGFFFFKRLGNCSWEIV